jgi:hypothetical protein
VSKIQAGDRVITRDNALAKVVYTWREEGVEFAAIAYEDRRKLGLGALNPEAGLDEHRVKTGKVVRSGGDYYNPEDWVPEQGLRRATPHNLRRAGLDATEPTEAPTEAPKETCQWLIQVASDNPEPDFPEDLWRTIECGAELTVNEYGSWRCAAGHEHVTFDDPARGAYDAEQAFIERQEG